MGEVVTCDMCAHTYRVCIITLILNNIDLTLTWSDSILTLTLGRKVMYGMICGIYANTLNTDERGCNSVGVAANPQAQTLFHGGSEIEVDGSLLMKRVVNSVFQWLLSILSDDRKHMVPKFDIRSGPPLCFQNHLNSNPDAPISYCWGYLYFCFLCILNLLLHNRMMKN